MLTKIFSSCDSINTFDVNFTYIFQQTSLHKQHEFLRQLLMPAAASGLQEISTLLVVGVKHSRDVILWCGAVKQVQHIVLLVSQYGM